MIPGGGVFAVALILVLVARVRLMSHWAGGVAAIVVVLLVGVLLMFQPWAGNAEPPPAKPADGGFAADRFPALPDPVPFDARRAMGYLEAVCKIGPRISGTAGMKKQQELLEKHFTDLGGKITWQRFKANQRSQRKPVAMANLIVSFYPERTRRVILCSHYDTRPRADREPDVERWREPFVSANDGGSGVALLMELAHHMKGLKTDVGVDFVFFDGEEYVFADTDTYFYGSRHFGIAYRRARGKTTYRSAILLDMVGGKGAHFPVEKNSAWQAGKLVKEVWKIAEEMKSDAFTKDFGSVALQDDHIPLNDNGIPAIDIVDFDGYQAHWHRLTDVPANCSGDSLKKVAEVLSVWLQRVK